MFERYLKAEIRAALADRMVFISGARQVGKTTLANRVGEQFFRGKYACFNWDSGEDRKAILSEKFPAGVEYVIFEEVHKFRKWKNMIKGIFDKQKNPTASLYGCGRQKWPRKNDARGLAPDYIINSTPQCFGADQTVVWGGQGTCLDHRHGIREGWLRGF